MCVSARVKVRSTAGRGAGAEREGSGRGEMVTLSTIRDERRINICLRPAAVRLPSMMPFHWRRTCSVKPLHLQREHFPSSPACVMWSHCHSFKCTAMCVPPCLIDTPTVKHWKPSSARVSPHRETACAHRSQRKSHRPCLHPKNLRTLSSP